MKSMERPLELQEFVAPRVSRQSAHEGGKVVSPKHRPPLTPKPTAPPRTSTVEQLRQVKADSAEDLWESGAIAPFMLDLSTRWV